MCRYESVEELLLGSRGIEGDKSIVWIRYILQGEELEPSDAASNLSDIEESIGQICDLSCSLFWEVSGSTSGITEQSVSEQLSLVMESDKQAPNPPNELLEALHYSAIHEKPISGVKDAPSPINSREDLDSLESLLWQLRVMEFNSTDSEEPLEFCQASSALRHLSFAIEDVVRFSPTRRLSPATVICEYRIQFERLDAC